MIFHLAQAYALLDSGERRRLMGIAILVILNSSLEVAGVAMVLPFIAMVSDSGAIHRNWLLERFYELSGVSDPSGFMVLCGVAFILVILFKNGLYLFTLDQQNRFIMDQAGARATEILGRIIRRPILELRSINSTEHQLTFNHAVDNVYASVVLGALSVITEAAIIVGIVGLLVAVQPLVTLVLGVVLGGSVGILNWWLHRWFGRFGVINNTLYVSRLRAIRHIFDTVKEIKVLGCENFFISQYGELRGTNAKWQRWAANLQQLPRVAIESLVVLGIVSLILSALLMGENKEGVTAILGLFAMAAFRVMPSTTRLMLALNNIRQSEDATRRVANALRVQIPPEPAMALPALEFSDSITIDKVGFQYGGQGQEFALSDICLTIRRGESIGLIGPTGSGKSTLMDMILGLVPPAAGTIRVDGLPIGDNMTSWRRMIGYVPQLISLIDDSVRRNVAFGLPDEAIDDARIWEALALAKVDEVIRSLPQGLDTHLGEGGQLLSGGQRQRVGLARALYRDPPILCMDEATSALDAETEQSITNALAQLQGAKTMVVIAHRLGTLKTCDRLVMMQDGRIKAIGTFAELSANEAEFRRSIELGNVSAFHEAIN